MHKAYYKSPIGWLELKSDGKALVGVDFVSKPKKSVSKDPVLKKTLFQFDRYFKGKLSKFALNLRFAGTPFQKKVWSELRKIDHGDTFSYQKVASRTGRVKAFRAAGTAVGKNPFSIIVPCHRVIASDGGIGGYAGGLWRKKWLLRHEEKFKK